MVCAKSVPRFGSGEPTRAGWLRHSPAPRPSDLTGERTFGMGYSHIRDPGPLIKWEEEVPLIVRDLASAF